MVARVFDHTVLNSYDRLQNFFQNTDAVQQVLNQRERLVLPKSGFGVQIARSLNSHLLPHLHGRWRVCQLVTAPFRWILSIVLRGVALLLKCLCSKGISRDVKRVALYLEAGFAVPWSCFGRVKRLLQTTKNHPNDQGAVSQTPPLLKDQIENLQVRNRVSTNDRGQVTFSGDGGICRGISEWFIYLYLKTKDQFVDPRNHMIALAQQFANGGGMDPTLLQALNLKNGKLLNMRVGLQEGRVHGKSGGAALVHSFFDWKDAQKERVRELNNLPEGIYRVSLTFHAMVYIKINDQLGFLFDPNAGIFEVKGKEEGDLLYFFLLNRFGRHLKHVIKTGRFWDRFELTPEELQRFRTLPKEKVLEIASSIDGRNALKIRFFPYQMREEQV